MVYDLLIGLLRQKFYILSTERFQHENSPIFLERYVVKHPLLKPELIVVNDQPHGFKKLKKEFQSLEKHPIYCEVEFSEEAANERYIEHIDLYAEAKMPSEDRLDDLIQLGQAFEKTITLELIRRLSGDREDIVVVYSKLGDIFVEEYLEQDLEEGLLSEGEIEAMFDMHIGQFIGFLKMMDDIVSKGMRFDSIDQAMNFN